MAEKTIITIAPTGNVPTRKLNPHTPVTPEEIARDIYRCYLEGAAIAHIHARDGEGRPTADPAVFKEIIDRVREKCDIIIQLSTGARGGDMEKRSECIALAPEMASLTTGSSNFPTGVNYNPPDLIEIMARRMLELGVKPELEIFDLSMIDSAIKLLKKGLLVEPLHFNLVLNVPGSLKGTPANLFTLKERLPMHCTWTVSAIGKSHKKLTALALILGGHVRVGIEDVLQLEQNRPVSNLELVRSVKAAAKMLDREIAGPDEARAILGLTKKEGEDV